MGKIKKQVVKYDLQGNIVGTFDTQVEAGNEVGTTKGIISLCCKNKNKIFKGHTYQVIETSFDPDENNTVKCPYCERKFKSYKALSKHIIYFKVHGDITKEKLLSDYKYEGMRPLCACGCGRETEMSYSMGGGLHFNELIKGHYSRIHNNWGHNQKAIDASSETRRKRFKTGEIIQWNKGKSWTESYSDEHIKKLIEISQNDDRCSKISKRFKGVPKSPEHAEKIRNRQRTETSRQRQRDSISNRINNHTFSISSKAELNFAIKYLDEVNIIYENQKYIKDIKQYCDFYVPDSQTFIEFDGDFWHCNPVKYPNGPINKYQEDKIKKDKIKNEWFDNHKEFKLIRIWESDAKNNEELVLKLLEPLLN